MIGVMELPDVYFRWLYLQIGFPWDLESPFSYTVVCSRMHKFPYLATVPHDVNRAEDGLDLRESYLRVRGEAPQATVLEVLVALASRASYMNNMPVDQWFKEFIVNLGLYNHDDVACETKGCWSIDRKIRRFNERRYQPNGQGGLFPLNDPKDDQRQVELWYQLGAYINERNK